MENDADNVGVSHRARLKEGVRLAGDVNTLAKKVIGWASELVEGNESHSGSLKWSEVLVHSILCIQACCKVSLTCLHRQVAHFARNANKGLNIEAASIEDWSK